jgi:hypothetical protein
MKRQCRFPGKPAWFFERALESREPKVEAVRDQSLDRYEHCQIYDEKSLRETLEMNKTRASVP